MLEKMKTFMSHHNLDSQKWIMGTHFRNCRKFIVETHCKTHCKNIEKSKPVWILFIRSRTLLFTYTLTIVFIVFLFDTLLGIAYYNCPN